MTAALEGLTATKAQAACLRLAKDDGGVLEVGGQDGRKVQARVWMACVAAGWLELQHGPMPYAPYTSLRLTDLGRALITGGTDAAR